MNLELRITKKEIKVGVALSLFAVMVILGVKSILYFEAQYESSLLMEREIYRSQVVENNSFDNLSLSAKSFLVWDVKNNKKLGGLNEEMQFPLASLTKLMTILVAVELSTSETMVTIKESDLGYDGDNGLIAGEKWQLSDIIDFVLLTSSNDGAQALATISNAFSVDKNDVKTENKLFIEAMNKKAEQLGMTQSFFLNETGLDINETTSGAYGSTKDMTILVEDILLNYPNLLGTSSYRQAEIGSDILTHQIGNTNPSVEKLPSIIASKTGFTDLAGGNLIVVFDAGINRKIIVSVLGSTKEERFSDVEQLIWAGLEKVFIENQKI